MNLLVCIY